MKKALVIGLAAAGLLVPPSDARGAGFADIQFWAGSGANQAALVIDWKDGKSAESLLWGYRWDGVATGLDMLMAVVAADPRLFAHFGTYTWGTATFGIGYDLNGSGGFGVNPGLAFDANGLVIDPISSPDPVDARVSLDAADHWVEGWNTGFWNYSIKDGELDPWGAPTTGASDRLLVDGMWDGYGFAAGFVSSDPTEPVAATPVPEPSTATLILLGAGTLAWARRRQS